MNKLIFIISIILLFFLVLFTYKVRDFKFTQPVTEAVTELIEIKQMPIIFDAQRRLLTALYREKHTGDCDHMLDGFDVCVAINPKLVVLHMTGLTTLNESYEYMKEPVLREERKDLINRSYDRLNVSAHYLVDKDGTIYSLMPDNYMARHAMGVNHLSIGIENVGLKPSTEQIHADVLLIKFLMKKYVIEKVISHTEVDDLAKGGNDYYIEKVDKYFRHKECGDELARQVRKELEL